MRKVIVRQAGYDAALRGTFFEIMEALDDGVIRAGSRVLIKPNFLSPARPEEALLTHPLIVRAAVEYVLAKGGKLLVADSPAIGSFDRILKEGGFAESLAGLPVQCQPFRNSEEVDIGPPFGRIEVAEEALHADVIINLPKFKTHGQMLLTLGVKNLFGCVVGYRKPEWHMRTGVDRAMFALLLVGISERLHPAFTILDGILAMEGEGPGKGGTPRNIGMLIGSRTASAVDMAVCRMLGIPPDNLPTLKAAGTMALLDDEIKMDGDMPAVRHFKLPETGALIFGPKVLHGFVRKHLLQRPVPDLEECRLCGACEEICPAQAISRLDKSLDFNYDRCIRCYCCVEVCPHGAMHTVETIPGRLIRRTIQKLF